MLQARKTNLKHGSALSRVCMLALSALLVAGATVGGTQAYLMSKTGTYVNTFVSGLPEIAGITLSGTKVLEGRALVAGEFTFELYGTDGDFDPESERAELLGSAVNDKDGAFAFEGLEFDQEGTYHYVVAEKVPATAADGLRENVTYDTTLYRVTVEVTEQDGKLVASDRIACGSEDDEAEIAFVNEFDSPDATFVVNGEKALDGRALSEGEFEFELEALTEGAPMPEAAVAENAADGSFSFGVVSFPEPGVYEYVVSEAVPEEAAKFGGVTYDESRYTITVTVTADDATGLLSASAEMRRVDAQGTVSAVGFKLGVEEGAAYVADDSSSAFVTFANVYEASPVSHDFAGVVELIGRDMEEGEFLFTIEPQNGAPAPSTSSDDNAADGGFGFGSVEFTEPGTYEYLVKQDASAALGDVTYDTAVHRVIVTVTDDGNGKLVASVAVWRDGVEVTDGSGVKYVNAYEKPDDGEDPVTPPDPGTDPDLPDTDDPDDGSGSGGSSQEGDDLRQTGDAAGMVAAGTSIALVTAGVIAVVARRRAASPKR